MEVKKIYLRLYILKTKNRYYLKNYLKLKNKLKS